VARDRSSVVEVADLRRRLGERRAIDLVVGHEPFAVGTSTSTPMTPSPCR